MPHCGSTPCDKTFGRMDIYRRSHHFVTGETCRYRCQVHDPHQNQDPSEYSVAIAALIRPQDALKGSGYYRQGL